MLSLKIFQVKLVFWAADCLPIRNLSRLLKPIEMAQNLILNIYFQFLPLSFSAYTWIFSWERLNLTVSSISEVAYFITPTRRSTNTKGIENFPIYFPLKEVADIKQWENCRFIPCHFGLSFGVCTCASVCSGVDSVSRKGEGRQTHKTERKISTLLCRIIYLLAQDVNIINI